MTWKSANKELDLRMPDFEVDEFDTAIEALREEGLVRVRHHRAAPNDRVIEYRGPMD